MRSRPSQPSGSIHHAPLAEGSLRHQVEQSLQTSSYRVLQQVRCSCDGGRVVLHGQVSSYYLKQVAQVLVQQVAGVLATDNRLEVIADPSAVWLEVEETETDATAAHPRQRKPCAELDVVALAMA